MEEKILEKFWASVEKTDDCWNWIGYLDKSGLPIIRYMIDDKLIETSSRRLSLEINGKTIDKSERAQPLVCKNKLCVNPEHLLFGDNARFWAKVQKLSEPNGCWIWIASQSKDLYGKFKIFEQGKKVDIRAHVYSWQLFSGRPVPKGIQVCHTCDHPYCVNPNHLFLGTNKDNVDDMVQKERQARGEKCGNSILNAHQVKEIRELHSTMGTVKLSLKYNVSPSNISDIIYRRSWKHIG